MTDLTLYWLIPRDRSNRVRWLLRELDVDFSEKQVPAIVTGNVKLSESGAILLYLLEKFDTEHEFAPERDSDHWASFLQWLFWGLTTFEGAVFAFNGNQGDKERANLERFLAPLDQILASQHYLLGDRFSAADIVCGYNLGLLIRNYDFVGYPAVQAYVSRLLSRPAATSFARVTGGS